MKLKIKIIKFKKGKNKDREKAKKDVENNIVDMNYFDYIKKSN